MNTDNRLQTFEIMCHALLYALPFCPKKQIVDDLQMIVERLTFSGLTSSEESSDVLESEAEQLFVRDLPRPMVVYVKWLIRKGFIGYISDDEGYKFVSYVSTALEKYHEVEFLTAVRLPRSSQVEISEKLKGVHGAQSRIVFMTVPSLVAGFVVRRPDGQDDYSLAGSAGGLIEKFLLSVQPQYHNSQGMTESAVGEAVAAS